MKKIFTLFALTFLTGSAFAQIPNPGFETWTTAGTGSYDNPTSWGNANPTIDGFGSTAYTCEKGTATPPAGLAFVKLTSKSVLTVVAPGVAVTGSVNVVVSPFSVSVSGGFPLTTRPANLTGQWQHMPTGADHGRIWVFLTKYNTATSHRDTIAKVDTTLTGMAMSWAPFTLPLKYLSGSAPDSGIVVLSSSANLSAPIAGSYLYADDLAFTGTVLGGLTSVVVANTSATIFPNPASGSAGIYYHGTSSKEITINVTDLNGKVVKTMNPRPVLGENNFGLDLKGMAQGVYLVQIIDEAGVVTKKLMVE